VSLTARELDEARAAQSLVVDASGDPVGELEAIYYDDETGEPVWLGVRTAAEPRRRVLAPVREAAVDGDALRLAHERAAVEASAAVEEESIDANAERELRAHYGLPPELTRYEEELLPRAETEEAGAVRVRKHVETDAAEEQVSREVEQAGIERVPVEGEDSGLVETLPDGSVSIPVFEEELVVTKRLVVRERVIVRKQKRVEQETVEAELRKERVEIEADPGVQLDGELS
jgi:uncharacterized protein (TIGR02271 family)